MSSGGGSEKGRAQLRTTQRPTEWIHWGPRRCLFREHTYLKEAGFFFDKEMSPDNYGLLVFSFPLIRVEGSELGGLCGWVLTPGGGKYQGVFSGCLEQIIFRW